MCGGNVYNNVSLNESYFFDTLLPDDMDEDVAAEK